MHGRLLQVGFTAFMATAAGNSAFLPGASPGSQDTYPDVEMRFAFDTFGSSEAVQASRQAPARKVTITGRLLYQDRRPIVGIHVMVMEGESRDDKILTTWKTGP